MSVNQGIVGVQQNRDGATPVTQQFDQQGAGLVTPLHGRYYQQVVRGNVFSAANQAAVAGTAALATTYTGLCISNPAGSVKNLAMLNVGIATSAALSALTVFGLGVCYSTAGVVTHTTPVTVWGSNLASGASVGSGSVALADAAATLVGTPRYVMQFGSGFTTQSLSLSGQFDLGGLIVVPPGGAVFVTSLAAFTAAAHYSFTWEEVPILQ